MEGWGISSMTAPDVSMTKLFGTLLGTMGAFVYQLSAGEDALKALGAAWAVNTAMSATSIFVTKDAPGDPDKGKAWLAIGAVGAASMLL